MSEVAERISPIASRFDELRDGDGTVRPHWRDFARTLSQLSPEEFARRQASARATVQAARLPRDARVEIDAIAASEKVPPNQRIPQADLDVVIDKMIALASAKEPPAEVAKPLFAMMQRRAAEILGAYGQVGANNKVYDALVAIVANDAANLWVRCDAAVA